MKSYYLTDTLKSNQSVLLNNSNYQFFQGSSYTVTASPVEQKTKSFAEVTRQVIANLEGGYYNPVYHNTGDSRYGASGETMFGIDRKAGGTINTTSAGKTFWSKIDAQQVNTKWRWNYIPPDPLQKELIDSAVTIMKSVYDSNMKSYLADPVLQRVIESDGRLLFNFIYACWNGPGWFQRWAAEIKKAYNGGKKTSDELLRLFVSLRVTSSNSLIAQGGQKISALVKLA